MEMGGFLPGLWELDEFESLLIWAMQLDPLPKNSITKTVLCAITHLHHKIGDLGHINQNKPLTDPEDEEPEDIKPVIATTPSIPAVIIELDHTPAPESKMVPPPVMTTMTTEAPMPDTKVELKTNKPPASFPNVEAKTDETPALDPTPVVAGHSCKKDKKEETW